MHPAVLKQLADMHIQAMVARAGDTEGFARRTATDGRGRPLARFARLYGTASNVGGGPP